MAYESVFRAHGDWKAAADLSGAGAKFVIVDANQQVNLAGAGALAIGALGNKPKAGQAARVIPCGAGNIFGVVAGAAVAVGAAVVSDASGRAITAAIAGNFILGIALEPAAAAGDVIAVYLSHGGKF